MYRDRTPGTSGPRSQVDASSPGLEAIDSPGAARSARWRLVAVRIACSSRGASHGDPGCLQVLHHHRDRLAEDLRGAELDDLGPGVVNRRMTRRDV